MEEVFGSVPAVVLDHVGHLNDVLALLVLLTGLKSLLLVVVWCGRCN